MSNVQYVVLGVTQVEIKEVDKQGRIIIPKSWRAKYLKGKGKNKVILKLSEGAVEIAPYRSPDLTQFFDKAEVDIKADLSDWHAVARELRRKR